MSVPVALWLLKALAAASIACLAALVGRLAALRGVAPALAIAVVALNPLVLVHVVGGAHNDGLMALAGMLAVAAILVGRDALAGSALVAAIGIKAAAVVYAPFVLVGSARRGRLLVGALALVALLAVTSLTLFGPEVAEAFGVLGSNQERISRWSVPATFARVTGIDVEAVKVVFAALYGLAVVWLLGRCAGLLPTRKALGPVGGEAVGALPATWQPTIKQPTMDPVRAAAWATTLLLVASSYMVPWYLIWALPLVAIARDRALLALAIALTALQVPNGLSL